MTGNSFGSLFKVSTFGESHGPAIGAVVDGCPPGLCLTEQKIQGFLDKRKPGQSRYTTQRREDDEVHILSGVFEGKTTGAPISLVIYNKDQRSKDYEAIKDLFRPGHADYTYYKKYGIRDYRGGGRSSARETAARVAAGAVARLYLKEHFQIEITGYLQQLGSLRLDFETAEDIAKNPFFCASQKQVQACMDYIDALRREGDSCGARVGIIASGVPAGWGNPVFDKLDAVIASAMMSINAAKAVEIGAGFEAVTQRGSEHRDEMNQQGFLSNHAGGILGGISTGQDILASVAFKPTSSIVKPGQTINIKGEEVEVSTKGRHDPCVGIRAVPIVEAMMALVLIDACLTHKAQNL